MRTNGTETLKAVARRSWLIVFVLVLVGVANMNLLRHSQGSQFKATARVVLSPTDLAATVAGFSGYVDPALVDQTEGALAESQELFEQAAASGLGRYGSAARLRAGTQVAKSGSTIDFSVTSSDSEYAVGAADLLARTYPNWRAALSSAAVTEAVKEVENELENQPTRDPDLVAQLNRLRTFRTLVTGNVLLVEPADEAIKTRPSPVRDSLLGGLIGLFIAFVVVAIREAVDTRIRSEAEIEDLLELPVLGTIEALPRKTPLIATRRNRDRYGDVYALLAANLTHGRTSGVIAVTSATPGEGKTTTAVNLAIALARRASRVAIVDFDPRRPSVAKVLKIPPDARGVESVLLDDASLESITWCVPLNGNSIAPVAADGRSNGSNGSNGSGAEPQEVLRVIPIRNIGQLGEALSSSALESLVSRLRDEFDYVVLDTGPALSVPDPTELAHVVDFVLIVVRHGRVSASTLRSLNRLHRSWPKTDAGAVLVGAPRHADSYAYYATR